VQQKAQRASKPAHHLVKLEPTVQTDENPADKAGPAYISQDEDGDGGASNHRARHSKRV